MVVGNDGMLLLTSIEKENENSKELSDGGCEQVYTKKLMLTPDSKSNSPKGYPLPFSDPIAPNKVTKKLFMVDDSVVKVEPRFPVNVDTIDCLATIVLTENRKRNGDMDKDQGSDGSPKKRRLNNDESSNHNANSRSANRFENELIPAATLEPLEFDATVSKHKPKKRHKEKRRKHHRDKPKSSKNELRLSTAASSAVKPTTTKTGANQNKSEDDEMEASKKVLKVTARKTMSRRPDVQNAEKALIAEFKKKLFDTSPIKGSDKSSLNSTDSGGSDSSLAASVVISVAESKEKSSLVDHGMRDSNEGNDVSTGKKSLKRCKERKISGCSSSSHTSDVASLALKSKDEAQKRDVLSKSDNCSKDVKSTKRSPKNVEYKRSTQTVTPDKPHHPMIVQRSSDHSGTTVPPELTTSEVLKDIELTRLSSKVGPDSPNIGKREVDLESLQKVINMDSNFFPDARDPSIGNYSFPNKLRIATLFVEGQLKCVLHEVIIKLKLGRCSKSNNIVTAAKEDAVCIRKLLRPQLKDNFAIKLISVVEVLKEYKSKHDSISVHEPKSPIIGIRVPRLPKIDSAKTSLEDSRGNMATLASCLKEKIQRSLKKSSSSSFPSGTSSKSEVTDRKTSKLMALLADEGVVNDHPPSISREPPESIEPPQLTKSDGPGTISLHTSKLASKKLLIANSQSLSLRDAILKSTHRKPTGGTSVEPTGKSPIESTTVALGKSTKTPSEPTSQPSREVLPALYIPITEPITPASLDRSSPIELDCTAEVLTEQQRAASIDHQSVESKSSAMAVAENGSDGNSSAIVNKSTKSQSSSSKKIADIPSSPDLSAQGPTLEQSKISMIDNHLQFSCSTSVLNKLSQMKKLGALEVNVMHSRKLTGLRAVYRGSLCLNQGRFTGETPFVIRCCGCDQCFGPLDFMSHVELTDPEPDPKISLWATSITHSEDLEDIHNVHTQLKIRLWDVFCCWFVRLRDKFASSIRNAPEVSSVKPNPGPNSAVDAALTLKDTTDVIPEAPTPTRFFNKEVISYAGVLSSQADKSRIFNSSAKINTPSNRSTVGSNNSSPHSTRTAESPNPQAPISTVNTLQRPSYTNTPTSAGSERSRHSSDSAYKSRHLSNSSMGSYSGQITSPATSHSNSAVVPPQQVMTSLYSMRRESVPNALMHNQMHQTFQQGQHQQQTRRQNSYPLTAQQSSYSRPPDYNARHQQAYTGYPSQYHGSAAYFQNQVNPDSTPQNRYVSQAVQAVHTGNLSSGRSLVEDPAIISPSAMKNSKMSFEVFSGMRNGLANLDMEFSRLQSENHTLQEELAAMARRHTQDMDGLQRELGQLRQMITDHQQMNSHHQRPLPHTVMYTI